MLTERIGEAFTRPVERLVRAFANVSPDVLTITARPQRRRLRLLRLSGAGTTSLPEAAPHGRAVALVASVFDMLDGGWRGCAPRTKFGPSGLDDGPLFGHALYMGLLLLYAAPPSTGFMVLVWAAPSAVS